MLAWLYRLRFDGTAIAEALPVPFMAATSWSDTEVTRAELNEAVEWLEGEGLATKAMTSLATLDRHLGRLGLREGDHRDCTSAAVLRSFMESARRKMMRSPSFSTLSRLRPVTAFTRRSFWPPSPAPPAGIARTSSTR